MRKYVFLSIISYCVCSAINAQPQQPASASEIYQKIKQLNVLGSALYWAAHPDDENTRLIAYLSNEQHYRTAYLSATRGDGGQNLIGSEIREKLGVIRTQELLEARKIDGAEQFFTRANDFGFSKHPDETLEIWDEKEILSDMVWVIRNFQPDIIITRFSPEPGGTHGHHTASAILAEKAFDAAADENAFPEQLEYVDAWQVKRVVWNTSSWFFEREQDFDKESLFQLDVGLYNPVKGTSYGEIAARSRSMHKSQGFGASGSRGEAIEYFQTLKGDVPEANLMDGVVTGWSRIGEEELEQDIVDVLENYSLESPEKSIKPLLAIRRKLKQIDNDHWRKLKLHDIEAIILDCMGLYAAINSENETATPGEQVPVKYEIINRSHFPVTFTRLKLESHPDTLIGKSLTYNTKFTGEGLLNVPDNMGYSTPYWLKLDNGNGLYTVNDQLLRGMAQDAPAFVATAELVLEEDTIAFKVPVNYTTTHPVEGEIIRPFVIIPPVAAKIEEAVYVFTSQKEQVVEVKVNAGKHKVGGELSLSLPKGWEAKPRKQTFYFEEKGESQTIKFTITPPRTPGEGTMRIKLTHNKHIYNRALLEIDYDHITRQFLMPVAEAKLSRIALEKKGSKVAYIQGAGDDIPASLQQVGYQVDMLDKDNFSSKRLQQYDAIILGIRAYNTQEYLRYEQKKLHDYVENGGTLIVQYNTNGELVIDDIAPFPMKISRDRVTVEDAPVKMLKQEHDLLNKPNKITDKDFEGWVQERGLYFANEWDDNFSAILASNDPGEDPKEGGLLVAKHGKGYFIYTGYSWFRQLPAGVPGAYRIFVNMLSVGK